jgi:hypothetical protein
MKISDMLRQAQVGTVDAQIQFLGEYARGEVSKLFQKLGGAKGDPKLYVTKADFRSWASAADRLFQDLKDFTEAEELGSLPLPPDYKVGEPPR